MSLINEALKKAQRLRNAETPMDAPPVPGGGGPIAKRSAPRSANTLVLIASGAIVLIVLSVIATVYLLNRPSKPPVTVASAAPASTKTETKTSPDAPPMVVPIITPPPVAPVPATAAPTDPIATAPAREESPSPKASTKKTTAAAAPTAPKPVPTSTTPENAPPLPDRPAVATDVATTPPAPKPLPPPVAPKPDERVVAFVESVRVAGIRSSGNESRVLMNDRVFRVNDIVDRTLGIRLVKVAVDSLTFADGNGLTYVKYF